MSESPSLPLLRDRAVGIVATGAILAILYVARVAAIFWSWIGGAVGPVGVRLPGVLLQQRSSIDTIPAADQSASSLGEALQTCVDWLEERTTA